MLYGLLTEQKMEASITTDSDKVDSKSKRTKTYMRVFFAISWADEIWRSCCSSSCPRAAGRSQCRSCHHANAS